ncbi:MAG: bifunctional precorrin-2 dehydrogenase/sirohydrochlorin ferrochelatase [Chloroflexota bacterium]
MGYPILLDLQGRLVVMIGGGRVAARKVADLLEAGAQIILISPTLHPDLAALGSHIEHYQTAYAPGMMTEMIDWDLNPLLVFAATDSPAVNQQVADEAHDLGILVNRADNGRGHDFSSMAVIRRGDITIATGTGNSSPALAAHLRAKIEAQIGEEYTILARWLGELRPVVKAKIPPEARPSLWRAILQSPALDHLRASDEAGARAIIDALIAAAIKEGE